MKSVYLTLLLMSCVHATASATSAKHLAPILPLAAGAEAVPNRYIVVLHSAPEEEELSSGSTGLVALSDLVAASAGGSVRHTYGIDHAGGRFAGFSLTLDSSGGSRLAESSAELLDEIRAHPSVAFIEQDQIVRLGEGVLGTSTHELDDGDSIPIERPSHYQYDDDAIPILDARVAATKFESQSAAPWNLVRLNHRTLAESEAHTSFAYPASAGEGVDVYVVDTGVLASHEEFEGRAEFGIDLSQTNATTDDNGHGTHVAGVVAGRTFGVAKRARIIGVKVLDAIGQGSYADIIAGVQWSVARARASTRRSVANMSVGGPTSAALNAALAAAYKAGLLFVVAAGNAGTDACRTSPASEPRAVKVAAVDRNDTLTAWSNHGSCVTLSAPGNQILSAYIPDNDSTAVLDGTSMASPHVAGAAALLLGAASGKLSPTQLAAAIKAGVTKSSMYGITDATPNSLLFVNGLASANGSAEEASAQEHDGFATTHNDGDKQSSLSSHKDKQNTSSNHKDGQNTSSSHKDRQDTVSSRKDKQDTVSSHKAASAETFHVEPAAKECNYQCTLKKLAAGSSAFKTDF